MDWRSFWEFFPIISFLGIKLQKIEKKITNEKNCNEVQNLVWNETRIPHASKEAKLFVVSSSTSDLKKNELSWVIDYGATQHMTSNRILTQLNHLSILVMILATKYKAVRKLQLN
jgi:hypothetical protein